MRTARRAVQRAVRRLLLLRARSDDTGATSLELVLLAPVVMALTVLPVQVGLWMHGRNLVTVAAQEAAHQAAAADLSPAAAQQRGRAAAQRFVTDQDVVRVQTITVNRGATTARASVTGTGISIIPGLQLTVTATAQSSVERFIGPP